MSNMRRYTAPGTYNCAWQVMNIASLDSGLERERESFVHCNVGGKVWNMDRGIYRYTLEKGMSAVQHSDTREEIDL